MAFGLSQDALYKLEALNLLSSSLRNPGRLCLGLRFRLGSPSAVELASTLISRGMPRLGYRKSRQGCRRCKQRRVKCDESRPCSACTRHGLECTYSEQNASISEHAARSPLLTPGDSAAGDIAPKVHSLAVDL
ncbi:Sterol uptake control protein 2 [Ilyonectria robusta]